MVTLLLQETDEDISDIMDYRMLSSNTLSCNENIINEFHEETKIIMKIFSMLKFFFFEDNRFM